MPISRYDPGPPEGGTPTRPDPALLTGLRQRWSPAFTRCIGGYGPDRLKAGLQHVPTLRGRRACASVGVPRLRGVSVGTARTA